MAIGTELIHFLELCILHVHVCVLSIVIFHFVFVFFFSFLDYDLPKRSFIQGCENYIRIESSAGIKTLCGTMDTTPYVYIAGVNSRVTIKYNYTLHAAGSLSRGFRLKYMAAVYLRFPLIDTGWLMT